MEKLKISRINSSLNEHYDIFICSASFEDRCLTIPNKLKRKSFDKIIILENIDGSEKLKENASILKGVLKNKPLSIEVNFGNMGEFASRLIKEFSIKNRRGKKTVLIDITTFTHEELLVCIKALMTSNKIKEVTCLYNNAKEYCANVETSKKWLSQGSELVHPVLGYAGLMLPARKTHLVLIVGYEYSRAFSAISDLEPSSISLIYGSSFSAITEKDKEANSFFKNMVEDMAFEYNNIDEYDIPCNDPDKISDGLKQIYEKYKAMNIIVIPLNSKMSTLGVIRSLDEYEEPQVCYAPALIYNELNYSVPGSDCYVYRIK